MAHRKEKHHEAGGHKSMKGGHSGLPREHFEKSEGEMGHESNLKYAGEFSNPHSLDKMTEGLASYVKKNQMKYE